MSAPKFREIEPLCLWDDDNDANAEVDSNGLSINMGNMAWNVTEARALRDWLNKALPEEKP